MRKVRGSIPLGSTILLKSSVGRVPITPCLEPCPQFAMDVTLASAYMRRRTMNWLLVLSALFSTLTGAQVGARPLAAVVQQAAVATAIRHRMATALPLARAHAHLLGAFGVGRVFAIAPESSIATAASVPLYLGRLRV